MSELIAILETLVADVEAGRPAAFCAVLEKRGSAPREPGATMLVRSDGSSTGTIGGGPTEARTRQAAMQLLRENRSTLLRLSLEEDHGTDDSSNCGGQLLIGVVPVTTTRQLEQFKQPLQAAQRHQPTQLRLVLEQEGRPVEYRLHVDVPPTLVIAGAGHVGQAVARLAVDLGFHVVVIDDRSEVASRERFGERAELIVDDVACALRDYPVDAGCYVVIATRGHQHDQQALEAVIRRPAAYIGMIASQRKRAAVLNMLAQSGVPQEMIDRVHTPIGLPIGAVTVPEIAVSIVAELIQVRRRYAPKLVEGPFETSI